MDFKNQNNSIDRREFLQISAKLAVSAALLGVSVPKLLSAPTYSEKTTIKRVTLNNGVKMPILGFGTLYLNGESGENAFRTPFLWDTDYWILRLFTEMRKRSAEELN